MKHIVKGASPDSFKRWKEAANADWEPSYAELRNPEKQDLHQSLLKEQGWVCCYCGRSIELGDSHIEHFRPQHAFKDRQLDFRNLHASCMREAKPGLPLHCGHAKQNAFEESLIIDPQDDSCERRFLFTEQGAVVPMNPSDERAAYMIELLSLDNSALSAKRSEVLTQTLGVDFLSTATDEELAALRDAFRSPDQEGRLPAFGHVIARYVEQYLP